MSYNANSSIDCSSCVFIQFSSYFHPVVDVECPKALDDTHFVSTDFQHCCHLCTLQGLGWHSASTRNCVSLHRELASSVREWKLLSEHKQQIDLYPASWNNPILHLWRIGKIYVVISEPCVLNNWYLYPHSWRSNTPSCLLLTVSLTTCSSAANAIG